MQASRERLPEGYQEIWRVDLTKNKNQAFAVNGLALILAAGALALPVLEGVFGRRATAGGFMLSGWQMLAVAGGLLLYIPLHELVHGLCMKCFGASKIRYGYAGVYAWAGSSTFFKKWPYIIIALAPLISLGIVLAWLCTAVPNGWFWVIYLIQVMNISGAAGDVYLAWKTLKMPAHILVQDTGTAMTFYAGERDSQGI